LFPIHHNPNRNDAVIRDCISSVTRPVKELKGFKRISLNPGEVQTVALAVTRAVSSADWRDEADKMMMEFFAKYLKAGGCSLMLGCGSMAMT
jgi:hypothetical protein